jgi:hypothetical protein
MITVVEKYRGAEILRNDLSIKMPSDDAALASSIVRFHAIPTGIRVTSHSIEAIRLEINKVLDAPDAAPGS